MKVFLIAAIAFAAGDLRNPHPPTAEQKRLILDQMAEVMKKEDAYQGAVLLRRHFLLKAKDGSASLEDYKSLKRMNERVDALQSEISDAVRDAMTLTQKAYGIVPERKSGKIANGPLAGSQAVFRPVFQRWEDDLIRVKDKDGHSHYLKMNVPGDALAVTREDGSVGVFLAAFERSLQDGNPGVLALTLYHEAVHFSELVTTGWRSIEEVELNAYSRDLKVIDAFELSPRQLEAREKKRKSLERAVWRGRFGGEIPGVGLHAAFPSLEAEAANFREWDGLQDAKLKEAFEQSTALEYLERWRTETAKLRNSIDEGALIAHIGYIQWIAETLCSKPEAVGLPEVRRLFPWPADAYARYRPDPAAGAPCSVVIAGVLMDRLAAGRMPDIQALKIDSASAKAAHEAYVIERAQLEIELSFRLQRERHQAQMEAYLDLCARLVREKTRAACAGQPYALNFQFFEQAVGSLTRHASSYNMRFPDDILAGLDGCPREAASWALTHGADYESFSNELKRILQPPVSPAPGPQQPAPEYSLPPYSQQPPSSIQLPTLPDILRRLR